MTDLTAEQYKKQQANCENLCDVPVSVIEENNGTLPCVRCPFCAEIVTALVTLTTISCPECNVSVNR